jgi:hypothetical protein
MPGSVRREEAEPLPIRGRAAETAVWCVVRMTMLLTALMCAEPWTHPPARPRMRKSQNWSVTFRNLFS